VYFACTRQVLPKNLESGLIMLRDPRLRRHGQETLKTLAEQITDRNYLLVAEDGLIHAINAKMHLSNSDPFVLFDEMGQRDEIDPSHAFYLGYEMAKAVTALTLGKNYTQDQALRWGMLTAEEKSHRERGEERG
jgi:hypothetical protein